jgi:hypothetical protein
MKPFEPDFFSASKPVWNDCLEDRSNIIRKLVSLYFPSLDRLENKVQQVGGIEINSSNYCIENQQGKFLLKKWGISLNLNHLNGICELASSLIKSNIPVPKFIPSFNQSVVISFNNQYWSLFEFDNSDFYSGTLQELKSVAQATGILFANLSNIDDNLVSLEKPDIRSSNDYQLFKDFFDNPDVVYNILEDSEVELLKSNKNLLQNEVELVFNSNLNLGIFQFSHFDLHPHNILVNQGEVSSFLDLDSIRLMESGYALGFASLKLCRQSVVKTGLKPENVANIWLNNLAECLPDNQEFFPFIGDLAIGEVLRRIAIILRQNMVDSNPQWNAFLSVQLNHLQEARLLFNN